MSDHVDECSAEYISYHIGDQLGRTLPHSLTMQVGFRRLVEIALEGTLEEGQRFLRLIVDETAKELANETAAKWLASERQIDLENSR